ncbi:MAG: hypothetical protein ABFD79_11115 [Phycisphaerales bacterium]
MNREQIIIVLIGILVIGGMFLYVPVSLDMMSLYAYLGSHEAGFNTLVFYRFIPDHYFYSLNLKVLFWQLFLVSVIVFCLIFVFKKDIKKVTIDIRKRDQFFPFILIFIAILLYIAGLVPYKFLKIYWDFKLGLYSAGLIAIFASLKIIKVYVSKQSISFLLKTILVSSAILTICMMASFEYRYSPEKFQMTPFLWRSMGLTAFLIVWVFYAANQFIEHRKNISN